MMGLSEKLEMKWRIEMENDVCITNLKTQWAIGEVCVVPDLQEKCFDKIPLEFFHHMLL